MPAQPADFTVSTATVNAGQSNVAYAVPTDATVTYGWSYSGTGATITGSGSSITVSFAVNAISGTLSVTASNGCGTSAPRTLAITVRPLSTVSLTGLTPRTGPAVGGTAITLTGSGFVSGAAVSVRGGAATTVTVVNGTTITAVTPAGAIGPADVVITNPDGGTAVIPGGFLYTATGSPTRFYSLTPCRLVDTRNPAGAFGGPALSASQARAFTVPSGGCGLPTDAAAVSLNVTVADATAAGTLTIFPGSGAVPATNTITFVPGKNRANNVTTGLVGGVLSVKDFQTSGTVNLIIDVNGYYR